VRPGYDEARAELEQRMSAEALDHAERVAEAAAEIAERYGIDMGQARLAGLLHDWHRETPAEDLLERAASLGIPITDVDRSVPYLLHGPVAAADLAVRFPQMDEAVLDAIAAHTYGAETMAPLSMVVYIADVVEPGRDHVGVGELRSVVGSVSLEELFARAYEASMRYLIGRRRRIHPATVATWNRYCAGDRT
jgi:predicted HD superfamily hydrolase involved in NAD metabolism